MTRRVDFVCGRPSPRLHDCWMIQEGGFCRDMAWHGMAQHGMAWHAMAWLLAPAAVVQGVSIADCALAKLADLVCVCVDVRQRQEGCILEGGQLPWAPDQPWFRS